MDKLGPYDLLKVIGRGGMGSVYRAQHRETGEIHAVKILLENFSDQQHFRTRFESEIRALIKLDHPNVVRIISFGQEMGTLYFAMELVEGSSLFQLQKTGHHFDWLETLTIAKQVARGLRHAHDRGVIHRDLKPGNLLVPIDAEGTIGEVKITDFGIAKRFGAAQITGDNLLGTMDFMSPEQAKGQPATVKSDLYSLGTVLYTLLAGKPPFSSNSFEESLRQLTRVPAPPVSSIASNVPPQLDLLIQKLMAKQPDQRIPTAQALLHRIEEVETELLESSREKTEEVSLPGEFDTFSSGLSSDEMTLPDTGKEIRQGGSPVSGSKSRKTGSATTNPALQAKTEAFEAEKAKSTRMVDYYSTVTDHIRQAQSLDQEDGRSSSASVWWVVAALLGVIGLATWGIMNAYRPLPADDLIVELESKGKNSAQVIELADKFLAHYGDDSRVDEVRKLKQEAEDDRRFNSLYNKLSARSRLTNDEKLSEVEKQFVEMLSRPGADKQSVAAKLGAFISVYQGVDGLSDDDQRCLEAARYFQHQYITEAKTELVNQLQFIKKAIESAKEEPDSIAMERYQSLIELYGDEKWDDSPEGREAAELMEFARRMVASHLPGDESL